MLHHFSIWLEQVADHHQHTISLIESISTTAAVIVALQASAAARRAARPVLTAKVSVQLLMYPGGGSDQDVPEYVAVTITNIGSVSARINFNFFSWSWIGQRTAWLALPIDQVGDEDIPRRRYPFDMMPNTSETLFLSTVARFSEEIEKVILSAPLGPRTAKWLLKGNILADGGHRFRADLSAVRSYFIQRSDENDLL